MKVSSRYIVGAVVVVVATACTRESTVAPHATLLAEPALGQDVAAVIPSAAPRAIKDQYIVVLADHTDPVAVSASHALTPLQTYRYALRGFAAHLSRNQLERLRRDVTVKYIEQDGEAHFLEEVAIPRAGVAPTHFSAQTSQANPPWNLDRLDQRVGLNTDYTYSNRGTGVKVYILGTGLRFTHQEFDGAALNRAKKGIDLVTPGGTATDCNGHSTHLGGTIGGTTTGVAKGATLYAVRVLDCAGSGTFSTVIAGVDWITYNHLTPSVGLSTLGGGFSQALNDAIAKSTLYGTLWVTPSGASAADACNFSPASAPLAITVAASDISDNRATFSNFGPCVDLYAPGVNILGPTIASDNAFSIFSGTASASAHLAGLAALVLQSKPTATPTEVRDVLALNAQPNVIVGNPATTPNLLANKQTGTCAVAGAYCTGISGNTQLPFFGSSQFYLSGTGMQRGYLRGTAGTNFDLELHEWNGAVWVLRVNSNAATTNPIIQFNSSCAFGLANCFKMFRVKSAVGTGSFDFWYDRQ